MLGRVVNAFCFWLLASLACVLFFIAVIWPPYEEYKRYQQVEREMQSAVSRLADRHSQNEQTLDYLRRGDPLIQRKLRQAIFNDESVPGRVIYSVPPADQITIQPPQDEPADDDNPQWRSLPGRIADMAFREEFTRLQDSKMRLYQLVLAALAISMAFIFFGTPTKRK